MSNKSQIKAKPKKRITLKQVNKNVPVKYLIDHLNNPICIYDNRKSQIIYANERFHEVMGYTADELNAHPDTFFSRMHPDDFAIIRTNVFNRLIEICKKLIHNKKQRLSYEISFRLRNKDDRYIQLMAQTTVMEWGKNFQRAVVLTIFTDITSHKKNCKMLFSINIFNEEEKKWQTVHMEEILCIPKMLGKREIEIMKLMTNENSGEKICGMLNMNYYTMRSHWRNILLKTECKSQPELKELAIKEGWI